MSLPKWKIFLAMCGLVKLPKDESKKQRRYKPPRVTVVLSNGDMVAHYAGRRVVEDGRLVLYFGRISGEEAKYKDDIVAEYAAGSWVSLSTGKRMWRKKNDHTDTD